MSKKELDVAFFLPTRKGSSRVKDKNTRPFAGIKGGLFELKLSQLIKSKLLSEIIISTNDEICIDIAESFLNLDQRIRIIERPDYLCLDSTNLEDLVKYVPRITKSESILWGHVTTPMANHEIYDNAIQIYNQQLSKGHDSLISVNCFQNFLLDSSGTIINNHTCLEWPRTQDLLTLYEINHSIFIASRVNYLKRNNRIGVNPFLYEMDKIHSIDIDWQDDFFIAEAIYEKFK